jgi:hypothetical protein
VPNGRTQGPPILSEGRDLLPRTLGADQPPADPHQARALELSSLEPDRLSRNVTAVQMHAEFTRDEFLGNPLLKRSDVRLMFYPVFDPPLPYREGLI